MAGEKFQGRLLSGERILWTGAPPGGLVLTGQDWYLIPFSLLWCGLLAFSIWDATTGSEPNAFFSPFVIPFVLVGIYALVGRFAVDAWIRSATHYAVTNQRVLVLRTVPGFKFTAFAIDRMPELSLEERPNGNGTIRLQAQLSFWGGHTAGFSTWTPALNTNQLLLLPDAPKVFALIQETAKTPSRYQ